MRILCLLLNLYYFALIGRVLLSWIPRVPDGLIPLAELIYSITEPVLRLVRPLIPPIRLGGVALDVSILLVFIAMSVLQRAVCF